ncbi:MAG: protein-L-isoaspartate O-methyltransferase [Armatimonadota bacterium]|nr:MAG: protein-L-isoaspartate O-methyltransferase [Armatimonadota bacterium]
MAPAKRFWPAVILAAAALWCAPPAIGGRQAYTAERAAMVERLRSLGIRSERVLDAMRKVPRHLFVAETDRDRSYEDVDLPAGAGHLCLRPYVTAIAIQALNLKPGRKVLQVGTSSGYCTAVLNEMTPQVYVIDSRPEAIEFARARVREAGRSSVTWKNGHACHGWSENAPYDAIIVTCATPKVPDELVRQLRDGGRMIVPIGLGPEQTLMCLRKSDRMICTKIMTLRVDPMRCVHPNP